jgi:hypothetical protein
VDFFDECSEDHSLSAILIDIEYEALSFGGYRILPKYIATLKL